LVILQNKKTVDRLLLFKIANCQKHDNMKIFNIEFYLSLQWNPRTDYFIQGFSNLYCGAENVISDWRIVKDAERKGRGVIWGTFPILSILCFSSDHKLCGLKHLSTCFQVIYNHGGLQKCLCFPSLPHSTKRTFASSMVFFHSLLLLDISLKIVNLPLLKPVQTHSHHPDL
jgi:hypothetical protein